MFMDEVDIGWLEEVKMKCGLNVLKVCIVDYFVIGDIFLVKVLGDKEYDFKLDIEIIGIY